MTVSEISIYNKMNKKILISIIIILMIATGIGGYVIFQKPVFPEPQKTKRFGVDGGISTWAKVIRETGCVYSGINAFSWSIIEPSPPKNGKHSYQWGIADENVKRWQEGEQRLQVNIIPDVEWAMEYDKETFAIESTKGQQVGAMVRIKPKHLSDWASFVTALVERYDADGKDDMPGLKYPIVLYIQIQSEVANEWREAKGYIEALRTAYQAAKKANSDVQVMAAGFSVGDFLILTPEEQQNLFKTHPFAKRTMDFLEDFLPNAKDCFDILSLHLNRGYESIPVTVEWFRKQMEDNGYKKPIWSEDTSSGPFLIGEASMIQDKEKYALLVKGDEETLRWFRNEQAKLLVKKTVTAFASGVEMVFISTGVDWPTYFMPIWRNMGLLDAKGKPKPAFYSFRTMIAKLDGFTKVEKVDMGKDVFAYRFEKPSGKVYVLWSEKEAEINLPVKSKNVNITDISGKTIECSPLNLELNSSPVFVEEE